MRSEHRVVLFSRRACHLCDMARAVIDSELRRTHFTFEEVLIDGDDTLERRYGIRVPVVEVDGDEAFEISVDPARLHALVVEAPP